MATIKQIRDRASYKEWNRMYNTIEKCETTAEILNKVWDFIDEKSGFRYRHIADSSAESLEQLIADKTQPPECPDCKGTKAIIDHSYGKDYIHPCGQRFITGIFLSYSVN